MTFVQEKHALSLPPGWIAMPAHTAIVRFQVAHKAPNAGLEAFQQGYKSYAVSRATGTGLLPLFTAIGLAGDAKPIEVAFPRLQALADAENVPADLMEENLALFGFVADDCAVTMTLTAKDAIQTVREGEESMIRFIERARDEGLLQGAFVITHGRTFARTTSLSSVF